MDQNKEKQLNREGTEQKTKEAESLTKSAKFAILEDISDKEKEEQERTRVNKKLFLQYYESNRVIGAVCKKVNITTETVRVWRRDDPEFAKAFQNVDLERNEEVEDILMGMIFIKHDGPSVRYYLDRKHPEYNPHVTTEVITGTRTLEDILDEAEAKLKKEVMEKKQKK